MGQGLLCDWIIPSRSMCESEMWPAHRYFTPTHSVHQPLSHSHFNLCKKLCGRCLQKPVKKTLRTYRGHLRKYYKVMSALECWSNLNVNWIFFFQVYCMHLFWPDINNIYANNSIITATCQLGQQSHFAFLTLEQSLVHLKTWVTVCLQVNSVLVHGHPVDRERMWCGGECLMGCKQQG